jgi:hypothetical protein
MLWGFRYIAVKFRHRQCAGCIMSNKNSESMPRGIFGILGDVRYHIRNGVRINVTLINKHYSNKVIGTVCDGMTPTIYFIIFVTCSRFSRQR